MFGVDNNVNRGILNGNSYLLIKRPEFMVERGAAPYILYVNDEFYCTCDSRAQADEEIADL